MAEMKKIYFLSEKAGNDKPPLFLSIFIWVMFITTPLSGLLNTDKLLNVTERNFHDNPQGFFTFYELLPCKISLEDTTVSNGTINEIRELPVDTTPETSSLQKNINIVIW
jgi:hypothetical protein